MLQNLDPIMRLQGQIACIRRCVCIQGRSDGEDRGDGCVRRRRRCWARILAGNGGLLIQASIGKLLRRRRIGHVGRLGLNRRGSWLLERSVELSLAGQLGQDRRQLLWGNNGGICEELELLNIDRSVRYRSRVGLDGSWRLGTG